MHTGVVVTTMTHSQFHAESLHVPLPPGNEGWQLGKFDDVIVPT